VTLVAVVRGPLHPEGERTLSAVLDRVRARLSGVPVQRAYAEAGRPGVEEALRAATGPAVLVPVLAATSRTGLARSAPWADGADPGHVVAEPCGAERLLVEVVRQRLLEAGARPGQPVVLVAAGSRDAEDHSHTLRAAGLLASLWGGQVRGAHLAGCGPRLSEVVGEFRAAGAAPPAVAPYLLAHGHHHRKARDDARSLGLGPVAEPLGDHPLVAEAVTRRYRTAAARRFALSLR
jgi:sirohydrochlorin ferrochelatase